MLEQNKTQLDAAKQFKSQFAKMVDSGAIEVTNRHGNIVLSLPAQVLFPSGVAELSDDDLRAMLDEKLIDARIRETLVSRQKLAKLGG